MKITIYTIPDCQFSKQEKDYLNSNKLQFEEKNLEANKDFLTEMLAVSNNFAGTPVTRIEKDDGTVSVLKGFTKEEFDTTFGFSAPAVDAAAAATPPPAAGTAPDQPVAPVPPSPVDTSQVVPTIPDNQPPMADQTMPPAPPEVPPVVTTPDPLKSVMDDLQSKSQVPTVDTTIPPAAPSVDQTLQQTDMNPSKPASDATPSTPPPANMPNIPDPDFK